MTISIKLRSPRYPVIGLPEAIEKAKQVYAKDFRNKIPKELVAQHMGYKTLNGASLGVISAVSKFGLLEGGSEAMWITPRAIDIFERDQSDPERANAIREAALSPDVFTEVANAFPGGKASDSAIRSYLITKRKFLPETTTKLIRAYRETMELVEKEAPAYDSALDKPEQSPMEAAMTSKPSYGSHAEATAPMRVLSEMQDNERELTTGILSKNASFRLIVSGRIGEKEIERLIKKLELDKEILSDADDFKDLLG